MMEKDEISFAYRIWKMKRYASRRSISLISELVLLRLEVRFVCRAFWGFRVKRRRRGSREQTISEKKCLLCKREIICLE